MSGSSGQPMARWQYTLAVRGQTSRTFNTTAPSASGSRTRFGSVEPSSGLRATTNSRTYPNLRQPAELHPPPGVPGQVQPVETPAIMDARSAPRLLGGSATRPVRYVNRAGAAGASSLLAGGSSRPALVRRERHFAGDAHTPGRPSWLGCWVRCSSPRRIGHRCACGVGTADRCEPRPTSWLGRQDRTGMMSNAT